MPRPHPRPRKRHPNLADIVDLLHVDDVVEPPSTLADLAEQHPDRAQLALAYLRKRREGDQLTPGQRTQAVSGWLSIGGSVCGIIAGAGLATTVLHYDGSQPINILTAFAWMVLLPALTMLLWAIAVLPSTPLLKPLQNLLRVLNVGRLMAWLAKRQSPTWTGTLKTHASFKPLYKWRIAAMTQCVAGGFHVGLFGATFALALLTDLAFTWSTTLDIDAPALHRIVETIAWPWHAFQPQRVPTLDLVTATRYYQIDGGTLPHAQSEPAVLNQWFWFLYAGLMYYGLYPRCLIILFSVWRQSVAMNDSFNNAPETDALASAILARAVSTRATENEIAATDAGQASANTTTVHNAVRVSWADADPAAPHQVGGGRTLAEDQAVIETLATSGGGDVVIIVDSAEPPVLEFDDFVKALRHAIGDLRTLAVEPRGRDATQWAKAIACIGDPHLFLSEPGRVGPDSPAPGSDPESAPGNASENASESVEGGAA